MLSRSCVWMHSGSHDWLIVGVVSRRFVLFWKSSFGLPVEYRQSPITYFGWTAAAAPTCGLIWDVREISPLYVDYWFLCAFLHLAHRAFWAARIRAIAAREIRRLFRLAIETTFVPRALAHRARWAAAIRARPAADIVPRRLLLLAPPKAANAAFTRWSWELKRICSSFNCFRAAVRVCMS